MEDVISYPVDVKGDGLMATVVLDQFNRVVDGAVQLRAVKRMVASPDYSLLTIGRILTAQEVVKLKEFAFVVNVTL